MIDIVHDIDHAIMDYDIENTFDYHSVIYMIT